MSDELDSIDKLKDLAAIGEPLGLSFPPGTSKVQARDLIREAQATAAAAASAPEDDTAAPPEAQAEPEAEDTQEAPPSGETPPEPAPPVDPDADRLPIARVNDRGDWWCPFCDHSMNSKVGHCPNCLAQRDGDEVTRVGL